MPASRPILKSPASAVSTTTIVVLVAMASAVAAGPLPVQSDHVRPRTTQRDSVAAMAAAVAAVARDLMVEPASVAMPALLPAGLAGATTPAMKVDAGDRSILPAGPPLAERLLDLPPPPAWS